MFAKHSNTTQQIPSNQNEGTERKNSNNKNESNDRTLFKVISPIVDKFDN